MESKPKQIVILTGAGISAESGPDTFHGQYGIWSQYGMNKRTTPRGFALNPDLVHDFYNTRRANARRASPTAVHEALARLERDFPGNILIVTQNIDDLHERAGSRNLLHMYGSLEGALCVSCKKRWPAPSEMNAADTCPACGSPARPDIICYGEYPYHWEEIWLTLSRNDLFVAIGTSGTIYPAAHFAATARRAGTHCIEFNTEASTMAPNFHELRPGPATQTVPLWVDELMRHKGPAA